MSLPDTPASAAFRAELLASGWLDERSAASAFGTTVEHLPVLRKSRLLLAVWVGADDQFRYPPCQFNSNGTVPVVPELLAVLPVGNGSGWSEAFWLYTPKALLGGLRPADVLAQAPDKVLEAALREKNAPDFW